MVKKVYETEIDGKTIGFRFNLLAFGKACEIEKCSVDELYKRLGMTIIKVVEDGKEVFKQEQPTNLSTMINFFYAAAVNYFEGKGEVIKFTPQDVADWIDAMGSEKAREMSDLAFRTPNIKNPEAPTAGQ